MSVEKVIPTEDKHWEKIENLHRHKKLTLNVKRGLRELKEKLEHKVCTINSLLEKPTKER